MIAQGRWKIIFQSTFPRGERRGWIPDYNFDGTISIHVPTRGTTIVICIFYIVYAISIHVPTRGTTSFKLPSYTALLISIHVPTRGTTSARFLTVVLRIYFNPRSHEGNDFLSSSSLSFKVDFNPRSHEGNDDYHRIRGAKLQISIHVPTRGTTPCL